MEQLKQLYHVECHQADYVAAKLGKSRNAVISMANRTWGARRDAPETERFDKLIDLVADAPLNAPVSVGAAATRVGLAVERALELWANLCAKYPHQGTPGDRLQRYA